MANLLSTVLDPLKSASDTVNGLIEIRDTAKFGGAIIELQTQILAAQQGALATQEREAAMAEEICNLKEKITRFETWETEKQRYKLEALPPGVHVYTLKEESGKPPHHICKTCYQRGKKSILDKSEINNGIYHLVCSECETDLKAGLYQESHIDMGGGVETF
jgi:hypothetical protein